MPVAGVTTVVGVDAGCAGIGFSALHAASNNKIRPAFGTRIFFIFIIDLQNIRLYSTDHTQKHSPVVLSIGQTSAALHHLGEKYSFRKDQIGSGLENASGLLWRSQGLSIFRRLPR